MQRSAIHPRYYNPSLIYGVLNVKITVVSKYLHVGGGKALPILTEIPSKEKVKELIDAFLAGKKVDVESYFSKDANYFTYSDNTPIIPGNTIKGAVRTRLELLLNNSCYAVSLRGSSRSQRYINIFHPKFKHTDDYSDNPNVCPVCDVFGSMGLASRVVFTDFKLTKGNTQVINYRGEFYEVAPVNSEFSGQIYLRGLDDYELGMVLYGMNGRLVNNKLDFKVMLLGRFKFEDRDFGRVKFSIVNSSLSKNVTLTSALHSFMDKFKPNDVNEAW